MTVPGPGASEPSGVPSFVGRGISWPMGVDHTGAIALSDGPADVERSMRIVLSTAPGERVMRPQFGCRVWELMFEPVNSNTRGLMAEAVRDALAQWEPRITVEDVEVVPDEADASLVRIVVRYTLRTTNDERNLVHPFYVIPREQEQ